MAASLASEIMGTPSDCKLEQFVVSDPVPVDVVYSYGCRLPPNQARPQMAKVSVRLYKLANDARVTPLSTEFAVCAKGSQLKLGCAVPLWCNTSSGHLS